MQRTEYNERRTQLAADVASAEQEYEVAALRNVPEIADHRAAVAACRTALADLDAAWRASERTRSAEGIASEEKRLRDALRSQLHAIDMVTRVGPELDKTIRDLAAYFGQMRGYCETLPLESALLSPNEVMTACVQAAMAFEGQLASLWPIGQNAAERASTLREKLERACQAKVDALRAAPAGR